MGNQPKKYGEHTNTKRMVIFRGIEGAKPPRSIVKPTLSVLPSEKIMFDVVEVGRRLLVEKKMLPYPDFRSVWYFS